MLIVLWRRLKLDWTYTIGELLIVTLGVLIALAIDQWNDNRLARIEERTAIAGILAELEQDMQSYQFVFTLLSEKEESLVRLASVFAEGATDTPREFLRDIVVGANFGWNQGSVARATYDDLLSSGRLGIIRNPAIRFAISGFYDTYDDEHRRIDERETRYPALSYGLVPRAPFVDESLQARETAVAADMTDEQVAELVRRALNSPIRDEITAEINFARFVRTVTVSMKARAEALAASLLAYQDTIR